MELYFAPLACSMATRIALYEAGATATFISVNTRSKRVADGSDFHAINPMGQVPVLRTDAGELLMENPVVLQYVADRHPESGLAPQGGIERYRLQQWLNFITSELHKVVFIPLLDPQTNDGAKDYARGKMATRFRYLNDHLTGRDWLLDGFTVADAYLVTVMNWSGFTGTDLAPWPALQAYVRRACEQPSVARAMADELALFREEQARRNAA
ncbi:MAG TPA: glutathione binding-like protein [Acetobacteraceae bacterium]|nr:glutathione binding-like protein [Acetobacteraceae bacterium]